MEMRILLLADGMYPFVLGGMQKHTYSLCKQLLEEGQRVKLLHAVPENKSINPDIYNDLFPINRKNLEVHSFLFPKLDGLPGHYVRENQKLSALFYNSVKHDLINFDLIYGQGFTAFEFLMQNSSLPIFINFHGYEMFQKAASLKTKAQHLLLRRTVRWMSRKADFVFSFGGQIDGILNELKVETQRQIEFPLGISKSWLAPKISSYNEKRTFVFLGRYERRKGIQELNQALKNLIGERMEFGFHFIGPINEEHQIIDKRIKYHGRIDDIEKIKKILRSADVLVSPSYSEGMPTVILESMSQGLAILATDVGAVSKMVDSENGTLIPPGNVTVLKDAIAQFIHMKEEKLNQLKENSLQKFEENFQAEDLIKRLLKIFTEKINSYRTTKEAV